MPQPNAPPQNFVPPPNYPTTNPPPQPPPQPNSTVPTYSTVLNAATTTNTQAPPPVSQPTNPQSKPPSIIKHFSHPHILKPMEIEQKNAKVCSACECELSGSAYCCTETHCTFNLHKSCFDSPSEFRHKSHLQHPLTLLPAPPYDDGFTCNACLKDGKAFAYTCATCSYDLHIDCIQWPESVIRPDHKHNLTLYYSSPLAELSQEATFMCDVCKNPVHELAWMYYCNVYVCWQCHYFLHEQCFRAARAFKHPSHPPHPLTLVPCPTYPSGSFICNSCNLIGNGFSYSCSECEFDIHVHCALGPNANSHVSPSPVPAPNFTAQNFNPHPQNHTYPPPIQTGPYPTYPPPQIGTISNETQNYPPLPSNPFPNSFPQMPQPNAPPQNFVPPPNYPTTNPPPQPPPQPNSTVPTYSTVLNAATTTNTQAPPPVSQPTNPQSKPPSIIKHFSHPHILKPMEIEQKNAKVCSACECELSGSAYCCTEPHCTFNLHKSCFDSPHEFRHKSHLQHPLTLLPAPPYDDGFTCNACLKDGKAFAYTCATCSYDLHIDCIQWPESVIRPDHKHNLTLYYSSPLAELSQEATFMCDVCKNPVHELAWMYYCRECDFGTHLECVASGMKQENVGGGNGKSQEELLRETELKFAMLQLLLGAQARKTMLELV
ncbi:hypothetical protein CDL12_02082 [Handroanthus impetiginosus]|uniref:DC1 domain-containing protein n=1 Tax=Handroanthus impetiginosus TaxID=429701 RepID=A0A2G9I610_9LAMI|nr:hypothetical protein CDL12_02082 [Handroanthus impetiginosus]